MPTKYSSWEKHPGNPFLSLRSGKFDSFHIHAPMVVKRGDTYEMYYTSYGEACDLAVAFSRDGICWEKDNGPIIRPDENSSYDSLYCSNASVILEPDGRDKLYYSSRIDMDHKYFAIGLAVKELI